MGRNAEHLPDQGKTWAPVDFRAAVLSGHVGSALFHLSTRNSPAPKYSDISCWTVKLATGSNKHPILEEDREPAHQLGAMFDKGDNVHPLGLTAAEDASQGTPFYGPLPPHLLCLLTEQTQ